MSRISIGDRRGAWRSTLTAGLLCVWLVLVAGGAFAQPEPPPGDAEAAAESQETAKDESAVTAETGEAESGGGESGPALDPVEIERRKDELAAREDQTEATKRAIELYVETLAALGQYQQWTDAAAKSLRDQQAAPAELEKVQGQLDAPTKATPDVPDDATLDQLKASRDEAEAGLETAHVRVQELEDEQTRRAARRGDIPALRETVRQTLEELGRQRAALPRADAPAEVVEAEPVALAAREKMLRAQLDALEKEVASIDAGRALVQARHQRWRLEVEARDELVKAWREIVTDREQDQAARDADAARAAAADAHPVVQELARSNEELTRYRAGGADGEVGTVARKEDAQRELDAIRAVLDPLEARFQLARSWARVADLADVGARLRTDRGDLPDLRARSRNIDARRRKISSLQFELAELKYEFKHLPTARVAKAEALAQVGEDLDPSVREEISRQLDRQLADRRTNYAALINDGVALLDLLILAQRDEQRLVTVSEEYRAFIDERIIWIRSMSPLDGASLAAAMGDLTEFLRPAAWLALLRKLVADAAAHAYLYVIAIAGLGAWLATRRRQERRLLALAGEVRKLSTDRVSLSVQALLITLLLAGWIPAVMVFIGLRLRGMLEQSQFCGVAGAGLVRAGAILFGLEVLRQLCRPDGLGDAHLGWSRKARQVFRSNLVWFTPVALPVTFLITAREWWTLDSGSDDLGRLLFVVAMVVLSVALGRVMHPGFGILSDLLARRRRGWLDRLRWWWFTTLVTLPLVFALMAGLGHYYTALTLERRTLSSVWIVLAAVVLDGLIMRYLICARRRLVIREGARRAAQREAAEREAGPAGAARVVPIEEPKLDVVTVDAQARKLVRTVVVFGVAVATWTMWIDIVPALSVLDRLELMPRLRIVPESEVIQDEATLADLRLVAGAAPAAAAGGGAAASAEAAAPGETTGGSGPGPGGLATAPAAGGPGEDAAAAAATRREGVLTLSDVAVAVVILGLIILLTANLPGILEITVLERLPLRPSSRYAIATIVRYLVAIVGVMAVFNELGLSWAKVQWLVAALSVGLGFGLQEIVANFICGLIILFERPVRLGDTVTIGTVSGTVTRIQIRATTIRDWDRKELIIPNKEFVIGQVINWTLSDAQLRVTIPVGIAYGSDTDLAKKLLLEAARSNENILEDPRPQAFFLGFGEHALTFDLRVFIPNVDHMLSVRDDLHEKITRSFREAGIEIALPKLDLTVNRVGPGLAEVVDRAAEKREEG